MFPPEETKLVYVISGAITTSLVLETSHHLNTYFIFLCVSNFLNSAEQYLSRLQETKGTVIFKTLKSGYQN